MSQQSSLEPSLEVLASQIAELRRVVDTQRAELDALRRDRPVPDSRPPRAEHRGSRRSILKLAAAGAAGVAGVGVAVRPSPAHAQGGDRLIVSGSSSNATRSEIGDGTNALTVFGRPEGVEVGSASGKRIRFNTQTSWDSDDDHTNGSNLDINKPAAVFRQIGQDHKGAMIEFQQYLDAGPHPYGIATNTPNQTFYVDRAGHKRVAWILAHYDSPNPADAVHQHLNFETCMADLRTIITRFQISWGEDVALCSFPNSNVRIIQSGKTLSFGGGNQVRAIYRDGPGRLEFSGHPVHFGLGQLQVEDTWVSPTWFAPKPGATFRSNTTTLAPDPHLAVPLAPNATYTFTSLLVWQTSQSADLKVAWLVPSGASVLWTPTGPATTTTGIVGQTKQSAHSTEVVTLGGAGTDTKMAANVTGTVRTGNASGHLRLQWAPNSREGSTTTMCRDSFVQLTRVL